MASIRRRGNRYQVLYRDGQGRQRSETFPRRKDAERRRSEVEVEVRSGTYVAPRDGRMRFGEWYARWETVRDVSRSRRAAEASLRDNHVVPRWADVPLDAITHMEAQAWVADLARRLAPATVQTVFRLLKLPLDSAVMDGRLRANPVMAVRLPAVPIRRNTADTVLTPEELWRTASECAERWQALVLVIGFLGLRWGEALGLQLRDVNLLRERVEVARLTVEEVQGHTFVKQGGKTDAAHRTVPLPRPVADRIRSHVATFCVDPGPDGFLFLTASGTLPLRSYFTRHVLRPALRQAGLGDRKINPRQLRHGAASTMIGANLELLDVQRRMGHSRPSVTLDVYGHLYESGQERGTASLSAFIRPAQEG